jgi:hypothetical protein
MWVDSPQLAARLFILFALAWFLLLCATARALTADEAGRRR